MKFVPNVEKAMMLRKNMIAVGFGIGVKNVSMNGVVNMERDEYILELKQKPKVDMGGCNGCIGRNGFVRIYGIICPFPIITSTHWSHVCTCSRKKYNW